MSAPTLTPPLAAAIEDSSSGATGVVRQVIDGLLALGDDRDRLRATADLLADRLPWCAPMWHVVRAAHTANPAVSLRSLRDQMDFDVDRSIAVALQLVTDRGAAVRTAPGSDLGGVRDALPAPSRPDAVIGLVGADALGPAAAVLYMFGTGELARTVPTIVVTTSVKLVPARTFRRLGAPGFETVDLCLFEAVVLDGEVLTPAEVGRRAAALG